MSDNMHDLDGWTPITCVESDVIRDSMAPRSSLTDPDGNYGEGVVYTEWADPISERPVLRDYRWTEPGRDCQHYVPADGVA
jgi:hypothetical protein